MKQFLLSIGLGLAALSVSAQSEYVAEISTAVTKNDQIKVKVNLPQIDGDKIFSFPKVVPGTYSVADYGKFVGEFQALDANGNKISSSKLNVNQFQLPAEAAAVEYWVNDSYDYDNSGIFEPAGTSFKQDSAYLLNMMGVVGYLEGNEKLPYQVKVSHIPELYGSTTLEVKSRGEYEDEFYAQNYFYLHDNPILYAKADTASVMVGDSKIMVAAYSQRNMLTAPYILKEVQDLFEATREYLGGTLPAKQYMIISYGAQKNSGSFGALEHWTSTVFYLPDYAGDQMGESLRDITAHEFLHIVTPLNLHSHEIAEFNFTNPEMSKHLWMYEGMTEYTCNYVQLRTGRIELQEFLDRMTEKMEGDRRGYNQFVPFTELSKNCLDIYEREYGNVYQKGALICWALDLKLRKLSDGKMGVPELMKTLTSKFGQEKAFDDEELFDVITELTYPEIREFFVRHVESAEPLPFEELLPEFGIAFIAEAEEMKLDMGDLQYGLSQNQNIMVVDVRKSSPVIEKLGLKGGDEILELNGEKLELTNYQAVFDNFSSTPEGKKITMKVLRDGKEKTLKAKAKYAMKEVFNEMTLEDENNALLQTWSKM